jgi:hypothetical protein
LADLVGENAKKLGAVVRANPEVAYDYAELGRNAAAAVETPGR